MKKFYESYLILLEKGKMRVTGFPEGEEKEKSRVYLKK